MQTPKVDKNRYQHGWVGDAVSNAKNLDKAVEELALITGQNHLSQKLKNLSLDSVYVKEC